MGRWWVEMREGGGRQARGVHVAGCTAAAARPRLALACQPPLPLLSLRTSADGGQHQGALGYPCHPRKQEYRGLQRAAGRGVSWQSVGAFCSCSCCAWFMTSTCCCRHPLLLPPPLQQLQPTPHVLLLLTGRRCVRRRRKSCPPSRRGSQSAWWRGAGCWRESAPGRPG